MITREELKNIFQLPIYKTKVGSWQSKRIRNNQDLFKVLIFYTSHLNENVSVSERMFCLNNNINSYSSCVICKLPITNWRGQYAKTCGSECNAKALSIRQKENNVVNNPEVKDKISKTLKGKTNIEMYGEEKAFELAEKNSKAKKGKSWEEIRGEEKAAQGRQQLISNPPRLNTLTSDEGRKNIKRAAIKTAKTYRTGKTYEEIFGEEQAKEIKKGLSLNCHLRSNKGKTYSEIYGEEKAKEIANKISDSNLGNTHTEEMKTHLRMKACERLEAGNMVPSFNFYSCEFFDYFDKENNTSGQYATEGKERKTQTGYFLDYVNDDLKLIVEWDEKGHYRNGELLKKDIIRQNNILSSDEFKDYIFLRIKENKELSFNEVSSSLSEEYNYYNDIT